MKHFKTHYAVIYYIPIFFNFGLYKTIMKKILLVCIVMVFFTSCVSTRSTLKNVDDNAKMPALTKDRTFQITEVSSDRKYGYDQDYPVNLGFSPLQTGEVNIKRYFGALTGPGGEPITYEKVDTCCPFPSPKNEMGAGIIDIYEVKWEGLKEPKRIHINLYEKGLVLAPHGFGIKKVQ